MKKVSIAHSKDTTRTQTGAVMPYVAPTVSIAHSKDTTGIVHTKKCSIPVKVSIAHSKDTTVQYTAKILDD